jgi:hypothetical protein
MVSRVQKLALSLCAFAAASASSATPRVCELAATRVGLAKFASHVPTNKDGIGFLAVDFDSDGSPDELKWSVSGSASIIPPDYSTLSLSLTGSDKRFNLEQQRLRVIKFDAHYYVVTSWVESEQGPWHKEVSSLGSQGITKICSFSGKGLAQ